MKYLKNNWPIFLIMALALVLRLPLLDGSFWLDEAAQALEIIRPSSQQLELVKDFQPPLLHLILHAAYLIAGLKTEWFLRLIGALIPGLITIWASYKIGEKLVSKKAGLLAALLLATNSLHIFYSQELRPYSLPAMLGSLSWLVLLNFRNNYLHIFLFFIFTSLGLYSSYLYPFLILSQIIYVLFLSKKILKNFFSSLLLSALSFLPWLPMFIKQLSVGRSWQAELPGWAEVVSLTQIKSLPIVFGKFLYGVIDLELNVAFFFSSFFILFLLFAASWPSIRKLTAKNKKVLITLSLWLFLPLISAWLISFLIPVLRPKRVMYLLPAFYLTISALLNLSKQNAFKYFLILIFLVTNLLSTFNYFSNPKYHREDWRALHEDIYRRFDNKNTLLVFSFDEEFAPWIWYEKDNELALSSRIQTLATGKLYLSDINNLEEKLEKTKEYKTILVFDYLRDLTDPDDKLLDSIRKKGFAEVGAIEANNTGFVRIYLNLNQ